MKLRSLMVAAVALATASPAIAGEVEYQVDPAHTSVGFSVQHMGLNRVRGEFRKLDAKVRADEKTGRIARIEASVDASTIDTGIAKRDEHLRSEDFFAVGRFAKAKLVSKSVRWDGDRFTTVVDLTIRDVTRPVTFAGELLGKREVDFGQGKQQRVGYAATAKINRRDFGLSFGRIVEGVSLVGDEVTIEIQMQIWRPLETAKPAQAGR